MNNLPTATLSLDLAWIGEGPKLQHWHPEKSWCDGFFFKTPREYADTMLEVANEVWRTCNHVWKYQRTERPLKFGNTRDIDRCTKCGLEKLTKEFGE